MTGLTEPITMRVALLVLALLAMIFGPASGSMSAQGGHGAGTPQPVAPSFDCDHGPQVTQSEPASDHRHCEPSDGCCMDTTGCRHVGCLSGGPVPVAGFLCRRPAAPIPAPAPGNRLRGIDVAPLLGPPRARA